jgi:hypothetical protein
MAEKVKSEHCEICGSQRKFTKQGTEGEKSSKWLLKQGYKESNPLMWALWIPYALVRLVFRAVGGLFRLGSGASSYRCIVCGSKAGAKAAA